MEPAPSILHAIAALLLVLGLIALVAWFVKRFAFGGNLMNPGGFFGKDKSERQLQVVESVWLDARYRVVVVKSGAESHTLLLGPQQALQLSPKPTGFTNA